MWTVIFVFTALIRKYKYSLHFDKLILPALIIVNKTLNYVT
ncbi:hypothetical protein LX87_00493 [Larkinella arboricola]|uniref:Uncharacterized protein n=1 Tax=Larkinella arboricola TaxID=643671 RepID=A0A327X913_LARAB|nr:hypothetical protein LX87_00493 [Larkinella arboricola]